jgi:trehalose 6-phosphate synthase
MAHSGHVDIDPLIVIASNRCPFSFRATPDGSFKVKRGEGGLVTALGAVAERHDVLWVAAALNRADYDWAARHGNTTQDVQGIDLRLVLPDRKRYSQYYNIIANPLLWFIHHQLWDTPRKPSITRETWDAWHQGYVVVNQQFAQVIAESIADARRPVIVFPQDYHLYMVPYYLRQQVGDRIQIQPFIHIPWPGPDAWRVLPEEIRTAIFSSLLMSDRVGFQTQRDAFNFVQTCRFYVPDAHSMGSRDSIHYHGRLVTARAYPISIDVEKVQSIAEDNHTRLLKQKLAGVIESRRLILRVDRIEPSKNILRGLQAFRLLLELYPQHRGKVQMLALLVPSRMEVDEYQTYLQEIMAEVGLINADYSDDLWEPVRIIIGNNYPRAIAAMQLYDVLLVNPIADGMNLVAKEGALVNQRDGVVVLSEKAGAFYEMGDHTLTVAPFDVYNTAEALHSALVMPVEERRQHAEALRTLIQAKDVKHWFYQQVEDALAALLQRTGSQN